eukprot:m.82989 g.82989  ORF g.82989 m.82989 type:complete len:117 (+) comp11165_c0_seq2:38-388(+)
MSAVWQAKFKIFTDLKGEIAAKVMNVRAKIERAFKSGLAGTQNVQETPRIQNVYKEESGYYVVIVNFTPSVGRNLALQFRGLFSSGGTDALAEKMRSKVSNQLPAGWSVYVDVRQL